jgi:predicted acylesterase/phospholipase RssA
MLSISRICTLALLGVTFFVSKSEAKQAKCHALVLSGGANKGAYEAGVIHGLSHLLKSEDVAWDVMTGVSTGSINIGGMGVYPIGQEKEMS